MSRTLRPVPPDELALFSQRIERSLGDRPLAIGVAEHRDRVAALVREVGGANFYQLLALGPAASPEKVHEGYERVARLVHPVHASHLGLEGREGVLEVLFERATAAYLTLSHDGRRRDYDREIGPTVWSGGEMVGARPHNEENRDRARASFNRAQGYLAKEEYHFAIEQLREAVRIDPQAKYYVALGELLMRNALWLRQAEDCFARALEMGGPDTQVEQALSRVQRMLTRGVGADGANGAGASPGGGPAGSPGGGSAQDGGARPASPGGSAQGGPGAPGASRIDDPAVEIEDDEPEAEDPSVARWLRREP